MFWTNQETQILNLLNNSVKGKKIINHMTKLGYEVRALNIVYLEGVDYRNLNVIPNVLDKWDDVRMIIRNNGEIVHSAQATTEPGFYYTKTPMNSKGAARIALGQHKDVWVIGKHKGTESALVQSSAVTVFRDRNKDGLRNGDNVETGIFGINQHSTGQFRGWLPSSIGRWSAGCLVGRDPRQHAKFMDWCRWSGQKTFNSVVFSGKELFNAGVI